MVNDSLLEIIMVGIPKKISRHAELSHLIHYYLYSLLNFGKRYEDDIWAIFDQWQKLHLGLDALSNQKILKGIY